MKALRKTTFKVGVHEENQEERSKENATVRMPQKNHIINKRLWLKIDCLILFTINTQIYIHTDIPIENL